MRPPLLLLLLVTCCSGQANSIEVYFQSENFHNVLHWEKVDIPGQTVRYSVEVGKYGEDLRPKPECQKITRLSCDLTEETAERHGKYRASVFVNGQEMGSTSHTFSPYYDTILGPPNVTVTFNASGEQGSPVMLVRVGLPNGPNNRSIREFLPQPIFYNVTLTHHESGETLTKEYTNTSELFVIGHLQGKTTYCGTVTYYRDRRRPQSKAFTFCETSPGDAGLLFLILPVGIGLFLFLLAGISAVTWRFLTRKKAAELESLNFQSFDPWLLNTYEKQTISTVQLQPEKPGHHDTVMPLNKKRPLWDKTVDGGYAPQDDCTELAWHCESYANQEVDTSGEPQQDSGMSNTTYSVVVTVAQVLNSSGDEGSATTNESSGTSRLTNDRSRPTSTNEDPRGPSPSPNSSSPNSPLTTGTLPNGTLPSGSLLIGPMPSMPNGPTLPVSGLFNPHTKEAADNAPHSPESAPLRLQTSLSPGGGLRLTIQIPSPRASGGACSLEEEPSERTALLPEPPGPGDGGAGGGSGERLILPTLSSLIMEESMGESPDEDCSDTEESRMDTYTHTHPLAHISDENDVDPTPLLPSSYLPVQEHFCPAHPGVPFVTGFTDVPSNDASTDYRQNWVPDVAQQGTGGAMGLNSIWGNSAEGEEEEEQEEESSGGIFLGGWVVQIPS
ncbi:interferon lambda receptor 1 [Engraulis encrasicolus]|uniref:interferon lambda receptor 1 n=1 Tax=Engraulis encrasicolus TaxID=184585 RepID=UPI002FD1347D